MRTSTSSIFVISPLGAAPEAEAGQLTVASTDERGCIDGQVCLLHNGHSCHYQRPWELQLQERSDPVRHRSLELSSQSQDRTWRRSSKDCRSLRNVCRMMFVGVLLQMSTK
jgi:hypothetical protein